LRNDAIAQMRAWSDAAGPPDALLTCEAQEQGFLLAHSNIYAAAARYAEAPAN